MKIQKWIMSLLTFEFLAKSIAGLNPEHKPEFRAIRKGAPRRSLFNNPMIDEELNIALALFEHINWQGFYNYATVNPWTKLIALPILQNNAPRPWA